MGAEALRHRITIQAKGEVIDANGDVSVGWSDFAADVPASWLAGPGREYMAAEAIRAETVGRFEIRYLPGVTAQMRILWDGAVYAIKAPPQVDPTGRREMTIMVGSTGMSYAPPVPETFYLLTASGDYLTTASGDRLLRN